MQVNSKWLDFGSALMYYLGQLLWMNGKKFRVTIDCDPETGKVELHREDIT